MKKYLFLSSALVMTMAGANASDKIITSANTCTVDVLGVSDNNATANTIATWDLIDYTLDPGEYLNVTDTSVTETTCPSGSYCVGGGYTVETANNSIAQCPTTHPNSADGASADTQCYTACTVDMVAKATAVSGNDYFGTGVDTCTPTGCETGYHVQSEGVSLVEKDSVIPLDYRVGITVSSDGSAIIDGNGVFIEHKYSVAEAGLVNNNTWAVTFDKGVLYGRASCTAGSGDKDVMDNMRMLGMMDAVIDDQLSIEEFREYTEPLVGTLKTDYAVQILMEVKNESKTKEYMYKIFYALFGIGIDSTMEGEYCHCQITGYTPIGGKKHEISSMPWAFQFKYGDLNHCKNACANDCAANFSSTTYVVDGLSAALYGMLDYTVDATCAANTINIDWNPDNNGEHTINQCTYEGAIEVPADPVKPGYTFMGWKLVE